MFKYIVKHKGDADFILKFYKKHVKIPKLSDSEWPEPEDTSSQINTTKKSLNDCMKDFVFNYLNTAQHLYDLVPLVACLGDDPYLSSFAEGKSLLDKYFAMADRTHIELVKRAIIQKINLHLPYVHQHCVHVKVRRVKASDFRLKNRHETAGEFCTLFSQFQKEYKNPEKWKTKNNRPFHVRFINENATDCGGPMRDAISNLCSEVMSDVLPLLHPTGNNLARTEPSMDCFQLNAKSNQPFMLKKFTFLGYFLGWSLRNMGGLAIDLPFAFWRRVCKGSQGYVYTIDDLREMDSHRAEFLSQVAKQSQTASEEDFNAVYDGYTFEGSFGVDTEMIDIDLCPNGASIALSRSNAAEFVELYLKKLTELENLQFERVFLAI